MIKWGLHMKKRYDKGGNYLSIVIIILVAVPLWLPAMLFTIDKYYFTPTRNIETGWDIDIPSGFDQIYHTSSDNFYARGDSYTVYKISDEIAAFTEGYSFVKQPSAENYVQEVIANLSVPKDHRPPFKEPYCYMQKKSGGDRLVILCSPEANQCYFVESFSWDE